MNNKHEELKNRIQEKLTEDIDEVLDLPAIIKSQGLKTVKEEDIDIDKMIRKEVSRHKSFRTFKNNSYDAASLSRHKNLGSIFYSPLMLDSHNWGDVHTISPYYGRTISYRILRRVSEKAWVLNLCVGNLIKKIRPFLKQTTDENTRGFRVQAKAALDRKNGMTAEEKATAKKLEDFFLNTGDIEDDSREDDLDKYVSKIVRDICQLDQMSTELQRTVSGEVCAFWAVDPATIEVALPSSEESTGIKYVQVVDNIPYAYYPKKSLVFDCMNPRTDIERAGYGYSVVEQAIDLITSAINTFMFNAGFFVENKLPRGLLLLNGDADTDEIEEIEDYIVNLMSGPPSSQWRIPIIPSGKNSTGDGRKFDWVSLQGNNREMEFQAWYDLQLSGIVGLFGFSMEDLGLRSSKSSPLIGNDVSPKMESSKSLVLGDMLSFLQKHFNKILSYKNPDYKFEFVGYEKDDPKLRLDLDKGEVESYKSVDEKRKEKGLKPFDKEWSQIPLNPQVVQMINSAKNEEEAEAENPESVKDDSQDIDELEENNSNTPNDNDKEESKSGASTGWDELNKSFGKKNIGIDNVKNTGFDSNYIVISI